MLLSIYLNDHLAGSTAAQELVRRAAGSNRDSSFGPFLAELAVQVEQDRESLLEIMRALEVPIDHLKVIAGWSAEKVGRLKLNGRLFGHSPLSRVVELEALTLGVHGKLSLWTSLMALESDQPALAKIDLAKLAARARRQLDGLEAKRLQAVAEALVDQ